MRILPILALFAACKKDAEPESVPTDPGVGTGVFAEGCPAEGHALARVIGVDATLPGKAAVGTRGDLLLANRHAAFAITDAVGQSTYWYYGGALADAVPMDGCAPGEDAIDDLGFVLAELNLLAVEQSVIRAFRADTVEVIADGSDGGPAIVRATGTDDTHWLVEHTLINDAVDKGGRPVSQPWGTEIAVDYILEPDSPVLELALSVRNPGAERLTVIEAALVSYGETMVPYTYSSQQIELGGFRFDSGIPMAVATDGTGATAWGADGATIARIELAGVNVLVDLAQLTNGFELGPGAEATVRRFLAVGDGAGATAIEPLLERISEPLRDQPAVADSLEGTLLGPDGAPVEGRVRVEVAAPGAEWGVLDRVPTAPDGRFRAVIPVFEAEWDLRLIGEGDGRDEGDPLTVHAGEDAIGLAVGPRGDVDFAIVDQDGADSPGRLVLRRTDGAKVETWIAGSGALPVPPGTWDWTVTRGYEYAWAQGQLVVPVGGRASLDAVLVHTVDTTGFLSIDTHVHSADSPDSDTPQIEVLKRAAGNGLEIVLHTEHENIVDRSAIPADAGVEAWVENLAGEEVTHVGIEHMTMFPVEADGSPRGGYVEWYGMDIDQTFAAMRARSGGGVNLLNHPGYLDRIQWDRVAGAPGMTDPTLIGLAQDAPLWSWDLDGIEVMNGHASIWAGGNRRFDNWMSLVNAGHPVIAVGCSDDHGGGSVGFPRTYFESSTDVPHELDVGELVDAFQQGRTIVSAGAFARVDVDGQGPGSLVTDTDGMVDLMVQIEALPAVDLTHFAVFANCDEVDSVLATDPDGLVKYDGVVPLNIVGDTQLVIAGFGTTALAPGLPQYDASTTPRVLTNPIYIDGDGDGLFTAPGGRECTYDLSVGAAR